MSFNVKMIFRRTIKTLLALVGVLVCLFFGLALYNHYSDEELSPEATAYFYTPIIKVPPPETNAVFSVFGLRAPEGKDPHTEGLAYWARMQAAFKVKHHAPEAPTDLPLPNFSKCPKGEVNCLSWQMGQVNAVELVKTHKILLERYRQMRQYPHLTTLETGTTALLGWPNPFPLEVHKLWMLDQLQGLSKQGD